MRALGYWCAFLALNIGGTLGLGWLVGADRLARIAENLALVWGLVVVASFVTALVLGIIGAIRKRKAARK